MLTLTSGIARCTLHPDSGGSIGSWSIGGQAMLRRADDGTIAAGDPLGMASFPLLPYSNRIGEARFGWGGETVKLQPNFPPERHAIHGVGWKRRWTVADRTSESATLTLRHRGDADWPWPFEAEQRIALSGQGLTLRLIARNLADMPVPLGFGHHPYFDSDGASLCFTAETIWMNGDDALPTTSAPPRGAFDFTIPTAIAGRTVDHCYGAVTAPARIAWSGRPLALEIAACSCLAAAIVYIPAGGSAFCFEPVPHITNALKRPDMPAFPAIAPGASFEATITFLAVPVQARGGPSESRCTSA